MRKQVFGRQFKRDINERKALFSGLVSSMILKGRITTTLEKAKSIKPSLEKLVTKARKDEKTARRFLQSELKPFEIDKMVTQIAPGFKNRAGGYTRIIKTGRRFSDNASMAILEWTEMEKVEIKKPAASTSNVAEANAARATTKKQKKVRSQTKIGSTKIKTAKKTSSTGGKRTKKGSK